MLTTAHTAPPSVPTLREEVAEIAPLAGAVAGYGPPVLLVAGGWVLLALMLAGPFAVLVTLLAVLLVAATALGAVAAAVVGLPYLIVRHVRGLAARRDRTARAGSFEGLRGAELRQA